MTGYIARWLWQIMLEEAEVWESKRKLDLLVVLLLICLVVIRKLEVKGWSHLNNSLVELGKQAWVLKPGQDPDIDTHTNQLANISGTQILLPSREDLQQWVYKEPQGLCAQHMLSLVWVPVSWAHTVKVLRDPTHRLSEWHIGDCDYCLCSWFFNLGAWAE